MQRMGLAPILCVRICITINTIQKFDVDAKADAHGNITCKQSFKAWFTLRGNDGDPEKRYRVEKKANNLFSINSSIQMNAGKSD